MKALLLTWLLSLHLGSSEPVRVVTTIPDLRDIAQEIGGEHVRITSIAIGTQNIHAVRVKPSALVQMNKADLFLQMGLSLEHAYVPGLIKASRNSRIQPGAPGFVDCSIGWEPIDVPAEISRGQAADIHPAGNPHFNLDPTGGKQIADRILEGLIGVAPERADFFRERHAAYIQQLTEAQARWSAMQPAIRGRKVVTYHSDFDYFALRTGLEIVARIEPKPGVPPTGRDLAKVLQVMKENDVDLILTPKWSNNKNVRFLAQKSGAQVLVAPAMVGGVKEATSWIAMMDFLHRSLAKPASRE